MITGDHKMTAVAIARQLGIMDANERPDRRRLKAERRWLRGVVLDTSVYARLAGARCIAEALQSHGQIGHDRRRRERRSGAQAG